MTGSVRRVVAVGALSVALFAACGGDDGGGDDSESGAEAQSGSTETTASPGSEAALDAEPVTHHLESVDESYASGDTGGARAHFDEAVAAWDQLSAGMPEPEVAQVQNLLDTLDGQLQGSVPASEVTAMVGQITQQLNQPSAG